MLRLNLILFLTIIFTLQGLAQKQKKADKICRDNLEAHVRYLADDRLEGRRAGSAGEKLAMEYISDKFKSIGLLPKGNNGYYQEFEINEGLHINDGTNFMINDATLEAGKDYFPFPYSARKSIEASPAIAIQEADMPWFVDLKDILDENKQNPHFDLNDYIKKNAQKAYDKAATAVVIYNTSADDDQLAFNPKDRSEALPLPVIYVKKKPQPNTSATQLRRSTLSSM